jgi:hypothetical protein
MAHGGEVHAQKMAHGGQVHHQKLTHAEMQAELAAQQARNQTREAE